MREKENGYEAGCARGSQKSIRQNQRFLFNDKALWDDPQRILSFPNSFISCRHRLEKQTCLTWTGLFDMIFIPASPCFDRCSARAGITGIPVPFFPLRQRV